MKPYEYEEYRIFSFSVKLYLVSISKVTLEKNFMNVGSTEIFSFISRLSMYIKEFTKNPVNVSVPIENFPSNMSVLTIYQSTQE